MAASAAPLVARLSRHYTVWFLDSTHRDLLIVGRNGTEIQAMEYVHNGPVMVWKEEMRQYVSPATGGVLAPETAAAYFRGILDGLVGGLSRTI